MPRLIPISVLTALLLMGAEGAAGLPADEKTAASIESLFTGITRPADPGLAVMVRKDGQTVFEKGYGSRRLGSGEPIDGQTNFRLASVTKQFTALAILLLVHDGKLHLDTPLTEIFPEFPAYGRKITVRNLLTHTSGLVDYGELWEKEFPGAPANQLPQITDAQVLQLLDRQPGTAFPPGTRWEYSNSGYAVLAMVVEKASGMSFGEFLKERIFLPAGMNHTVAYEKGRNDVPHRAYGNSRPDGGANFVETDQSPTSAVLGDGGIYSSLEDLARWDDALRTHRLLSAEEFRPALQPATLADGSPTFWPKEPGAAPGEAPRPVSYGFGWFLDPFSGHARNYHDGETMGFRSTIQRFTEDGYTIVVLSNRTDLNPDKLSLEVADILFRNAPARKP